MQIRIPFSSYTCKLDQVQSLIELLRVECLDIVIEEDAGDQSMETEEYEAHYDSGGTSSFNAPFSESKTPSLKVNHVSAASTNSKQNQIQSDHSYNFETDKESQTFMLCNCQFP